MKLSGSNIKTFLTFFQKKAILVFREMETPKEFFISGGTSKAPPKNFLYFSQKIYE